METKLSKLLAYMEAEDWRAALKLAASFGRLGEHEVRIRKGWEACARPDFQRQIGRDPEAIVADGIEALKERYGKALAG